MKHKIFFFLLFCNSILTFAQNQKISNGKYFPVKKDFGFVNNLFALDNGKFQFMQHHCQGLKYGEGTYKIRNQKLILNFIDLKFNPSKNNYHIENQTVGNSDSLTLVFKIMDNDNYGIPNTGIGIDVLKIGAISDREGKARLKIAKSHLPLSLKVQQLGYQTIDIQLNTDLKKFDQQTCTVLMNGLTTELYTSKNRLKFNIKKIGENDFDLEISPNHQVHFEKISEEEYNKMIEIKKNW